MKKLYEISQILAKPRFLSANTIYIILRTFSIFLPALLISLLLRDIVTFPATTPAVFVIVFTGWITMIFGFWGALLYLMRKD